MTIVLWLHGHTDETQRAYLMDIVQFLESARVPLRSVTLEHLQHFEDELAELAPASTRRKLSSVKSLLSFAHRLGAIEKNPGVMLRLPKVPVTRGEKIISPTDVHRILAREQNERNAVLLLTLYAAAPRVQECANLRGRDVQPHGTSGVLNIWGKGGKSRVVRVSARTFAQIVRILPVDASEPIFDLSPRQIERIAKAAAVRAGVDARFTPHWFRHAHASHAIDRGCPLSLVQHTLGHAQLSTTGIYLHARPMDSSALYLGV